VADRRSNELVVEWHPLDADQIEAFEVLDEEPANDSQISSYVALMKERWA
jgi:hypothetical protein